MSPYRKRLKTPEQIELELKRRDLARYRSELGEWEQTFSRLKAEIRTFEQLYEETLGSRIAVLEELEWQVSGILGTEPAPSAQELPSGEGVFASFHHTTDLLDDEEDAAPDYSHKSLKSLYRGVAKAVHPDLASDEADRTRRQELMAIANQAYEAGDRRVLEEILGDWERVTGTVSGKDIGSELVGVIRMIARIRQSIHAVLLQIDELKQTDIYRFKQRVDAARAEGIDLLAEMAAKLDDDIARSRRRLALLKGEGDIATDREAPPLETRFVRFPADRPCGTLYVRPAGSADHREWRWLGSAQGVREIGIDRELRLDVKGRGAGTLDFLDDLQADELQALFLNDADDSVLRHLAHLTGLQEICLSNSSVSDEGLLLLAPLHGLQRLSIYQTPMGDGGLLGLTRLKGLKWLTCSGTRITEEGLSRFRQQMPGCKAISFKWRYEK